MPETRAVDRAHRSRVVVASIVVAMLTTLGFSTQAAGDGIAPALTSFAAMDPVVGPGESALVVAEFSPPLGQGYTLGVYSSAGTKVGGCSSGHSCSFVITVAPYESETVTAYLVRGSAPDSPPAGAAASRSATVSKSGWTITSFAALEPVVDPGQSGAVALELSPALGEGYSVGVYNSSGVKVGGCSRGTSCVIPVPVTPYTSETVTAYLVRGSAPDSPPAGAAASRSATVSKSGWTITSFAALDPFVEAGQAGAVRATVSPALGDGHVLVIYDGDGNEVGGCHRGTECVGATSIPAGTIQSFRAYIVDGYPPAGGPPTGARTVSGAAVVSSIPEDEVLYSDAYVALIVGLSAKYVTTEAVCVALGEALPTHTMGLSAPDATNLCTTIGAARTLDLLAGTLGTAVVVAVLIDILTGPQPPPSAPECGLSDPDGECTQEPDFTEPTQQPDPDPQPDPGGAASGVLPPGNCITDPGLRQAFEDSMPEQYHHMATQYGEWGVRFQDLLDEYGYLLSVADPTRSWNVHPIPHRGPHPVEYHQWVYMNMERAARTAGPGNIEEFKRLFDLWVVQPVLNDPTIVRLAYWKCYR